MPLTSTVARLRSPRGESWIVVAAVGVIAALVVIRLGASLLGLQVFAGVDLLAARAPWNDGGTRLAVDNPFVGDTIDSLIPGLLEARERLWSGDFPLWSTNSAPGTPLLSSPNLGWATPLTVWLVVLPTGWALGFVKLLQIVVAFLFMAWWLRRLSVGWPGAAAAGMAYCGSGFFVAWANWVPQATVAALLPVLFWSVERLLQERRLVAAIPVTLSVACLLLAGFPAAAGHGLYAAAAYFVVRLVADRKIARALGSIRTLLLTIAAVVTGVALAAFQLAPFLAQLADADLSYRGNQFFGELPFRSLMSTVLPRAFTLGGYPTSNAIESYAYLGAGTVLLGVLALLMGRLVRARRGAVGFLVTSLLVTGAIVWFQGWWTAWLSGVPVLAQNAPGRLRDLIGLFACALAGIGLDALLRSDLSRFAIRRRAAVTIVGGVLGLVTIGGLYLHYRGEAPNRSALTVDAAIAAAVLALIVIAVLFSSRRAVMVAATALAIVLAGTQLVINTAFYWPSSDDSDFYPENSLIAAAQEHVAHDRALLLGTFLGSTSSAYDIRTLTGHAFQPPPWAEYVRAIDPKAYTPPGRTSTNPSIGVNLAGDGIRSPLLDRSGTRWVVSSPAYPVPGVVVSIDGGAPPGIGAGTGSDELAAGGIVSVPMRSMPIRGIQIGTIATPGPERVRLEVTVADATGTTVAVGTITRAGLAAGWQTVPIAGEALPDDGAPLTVSVRTDHPVGLSTTAGTPVLRPIRPRPDGLRLETADTHGVLWERLNSMSRIRWAEKSQVVSSGSERLQLLAAGRVPADTVVLDEPDDAPATGGPASTSIVTDSGDRIVVDVTATGSGHLVLAEPLTKDWSATIDGAAAAIVPADHAFSAIAVGTGAHRVELKYVGQRIGTGLLISGIAVLLVLGVLLFGLLRRRSSRSTPAATDGCLPGIPGVDAVPPAPPDRRLHVPEDGSSVTGRLPLSARTGAGPRWRWPRRPN